MKTHTLVTNRKFGVIYSLLPVSLFTIGLIVISAMPALAGSGGFSSTGSMNTGRESFAFTVLSNGKVLAAGGFDNGALSSAELYNPATGSWTATGSMTGSAGAAVLLQNGDVFDSNDSLYNPSTGTWTA